VWFVLNRTNRHNPLWALISVITVTEPELSAAFLAFNSRVANTLIGCAVGLLVLYLLGPSFWSILLGIIVSVFICTSGAYPAPGFPRPSNAQKKFCSEVPPLCSLLMSLLSFNAVFTARLLDEVPEMAELP
jgi:hypothetical protein